MSKIMDTKSRRNRGESMGGNVEEKMIATAQLGINFNEAWLNLMI
jgi:hypothetical protein